MISPSNSSQPSPFSAETGTIARNGWAFLKASSSGKRTCLGVLSTLFSARIVRPSNRFARSTSSGSTCTLPPRPLAASLASTISTSTSIPSSAAATSFIICRFSTVRASCKPGVSITTTCPSFRDTMPWMRLRVVCGFDVTIATFCPTSRFSSVDFPALGRPTIATNPALYAGLPFFSALTRTSFLLSFRYGTAEPGDFPGCLRRPGCGARSQTRLAGVHGGAGQLLHFHPQDLSLVRFEHFKAVPLQVKFVARGRHLPAYVAEQPRDGRHGLVRVFAEVHAEHLFHLPDGGAAAHYQRTGPFPHHLELGMSRVRPAFPDDLFDQVLHRGNTGHAAVFVDDHGHGLAALPHLLQQIRPHFGFWHEQRRSHQLAHLALWQVGVFHLQQVLRVRNAHDVVERTVENRQARESGLGEFRVRLFERC